MPRYDNQGVDLDAAKRHQDMLIRRHEAGVRDSEKQFAEKVKKYPLADWTHVEGTLVLRAGSSRYVASPRNGKKSAATFDVIDLKKREYVTLLKKNEVYSWLWKASQVET
jgi:hypothetical protein